MPCPGTPGSDMMIPATTSTNTVTVSLAYRNSGFGTARAVTLLLSLPTAAGLVSATAGGALDAATHEVIWTLGDVTADSSGSVSATVSLPASGLYTFQVQANWTDGFTSKTAISSTVSTSYAPVDAIVISQIFGGGGNAGAFYANDFIELFNRGNIPINLSDWSVQSAPATGVVSRMKLKLSLS